MPFERLVLFDGLCGLCDKSVQWLLDHDPEGVLKFTPLQGETAAALMQRIELPENLDSIIFIDRTDGEEKVFVRSRALMRITSHLPGGWRRLSWLRIFPAFLTDLGYRLIAAMRYRIWGKRDVCRIPKPEERARFLP